MANSYTESDVNQILNSPGIFYFRPYGSTGSYIKAVFTNGSTFAYAPETFTQEFDDAGEVYDTIGKETGSIGFGFGKPFDLDFMSELSGGIFTKSTVSSGSQVVENQTIAGGWTNLQLNVLVLKDSSDVSYQAEGTPAITSVTASTAGALALNDDYTIVPDPNSYSGYSISLNTAGTAGVLTTEDIVIVFNDPTVKGVVKMTGGGLKSIGAIEGYYDTVLKDLTPAKVVFYKGYYNGQMNLGFGTEAAPDAVVTDVAISLKLDTTRTVGDQLFSLEKGA